MMSICECQYKGVIGGGREKVRRAYQRSEILLVGEGVHLPGLAR